jgi:hypothetical protein
MPTLVMKEGQVYAPCLSEKMVFNLGLDPLGLQNVSEQIYATLLPGLNNVTGRIRCYSFYCWLLDQYAIVTDGNPTVALQQRFIRRAEYLAALIAETHDVPGVSGSEYAAAQFADPAIDIFDLDTGIFNQDGTTDKTYWAYPFGVMGQYYLGSMRQMGIIVERVAGQRMYVRTPASAGDASGFVSGEALAAAFDKNLSPANKALFLACIQDGGRGVIRQELVALFQDFNLTAVPLQTEEQSLLLDMLVQVDVPAYRQERPSFLRKLTIKAYLTLLAKTNKKQQARDFTRYAYGQQATDINATQCLTGWYYYQLNEYFHVACTAIFNGLLFELHELQASVSLRAWLTQLAVQTMINLKNDSALQDEIPVASLFADQSAANELSLYQLLMKENGIKRIAAGFLLLAKIYATNSDHVQDLKRFADAKNIEDDSHGLLQFFTDVHAHAKQPLRQFIYECFQRRIINRHRWVAFRKMTAGQSTEKLILEDGWISYIGNFEPGFTGPRIDNVIAFLEDLGVIDHTTGLLTPFGNDWLKNLSDAS